MKISKIGKLENNLEFYKEKCEQYEKLNLNKKEMEMQYEDSKFKIDEYEKTINSLNTKLETYKNKLSEEKTKSINFQLEISKQKTEIQNILEEKQELEINIMKKDEKIDLLNEKLDKLIDDNNPSQNLFSELGNAMKDIEGVYQNRMSILEKQKTLNLEKEFIYFINITF